MSVKHAILTLLSQSPRHRYDLKVSFESMVHNQWKLNAGQIYTTIDRLVRDELVEEASDEGGDVKIYRITEKGVEEVQQWLMQPGDMSLLEDDFFLKLLCAKKLDQALVDTLITQQKQRIITRIFQLQELRNGIEYTKENEIIHYLIEGKILHLEADMHWVERGDRDRVPPYFN